LNKQQRRLFDDFKQKRGNVFNFRKFFIQTSQYIKIKKIKLEEKRGLNMSKYLKMIPVMLYPYAYLIPLLTLFLTPAEGDNMANVYVFVFIYAIALHIVVLGLSIFNAIVTARSTKYDCIIDAKINMITKCVQIPAYIFHFCLGCLGLTMSIWGIGVIIFAVLVDFLSILMTGISSIGLHVRMSKDKIVNKTIAFWLGFGSFLYCIDVAIAIFDFVFCTYRNKKTGTIAPA
jgi:hypothetical protein